MHAYTNEAGQTCTMRDSKESWLSSIRCDRKGPARVNAYDRRIACERRLLEYARSVGYDRKKVVDYCMEHNGWLGRDVFETSFDDGSMILMAQWYCEV